MGQPSDHSNAVIFVNDYVAQTYIADLEQMSARVGRRSRKASIASQHVLRRDN